MKISNFKGKYVIVDVDGTLADITDRLELAQKAKTSNDKRMNWTVFLDPNIMLKFDKPNHDVISLVNLLRASGAKIIITSARNEIHRTVTEKQLEAWGVKYEKLFLRADGDFRGDEIVKQEILQKIRSEGYEPVLAIDDRQKVVDMWWKNGITCWQVRQTIA